MAGFLRITSSRYQAVSRALYGDGVLVTGSIYNNQDVELRAGVAYRLRVTGVCDYSPSSAMVLTLLRPSDQ